MKMKRIIKSIEEKYQLPVPECLIVKELISGGLEGIKGVVAYDDSISCHGGGN